MFVLDVASTIDGYWADRAGESVYPIDEVHEAGLLAPLIERAGAVVMSGASFEMVDDPDWYADNYELQVALFVVTGDPPDRRPKENGRLTFEFVDGFDHAFEQAHAAAGAKDVIVIGESSAVQAALAARVIDEIHLRVVTRTLGAGKVAFPMSDELRQEFEVVDTILTPSAVHIHLRRNGVARTGS